MLDTQVGPKDHNVDSVDIIRGASCVVTLFEKILALKKHRPFFWGLEASFFCAAEPASWNILWGKVPCMWRLMFKGLHLKNVRERWKGPARPFIIRLRTPW